jgi:perosamine synthetase
MDRIPISGPWITQKEIEYVADAAANAWYDSANIYHERFEKAFAEYIGVRFAVSLPSCTAAIHLALLAHGVGNGDEVVVPDATWIASAAPVTYVGATTVFADIDAKNWCLSPQAFEACITPRTKAVIPVDLYGNMADMEAIRDIARQHNIFVIEDAAEAIGSEFNGRKSGSLGEVGVFSFHGSKTLTTGEGGMLVTDNEALLRRVLFLRDHGRKPGDVMFFNAEVAYKYKMSSLQAALGLAQLERVEELVTRKREIFAWYHENLKDVPGLSLNYEAPGTKSTFWMNTIILDRDWGLGKEAVMKALREYGIDTRPFFHPLSAIPAYQAQPQAGIARERNRISQEICPFGINLPSALNLTREKVDFVCDKLQSTLDALRAEVGNANGASEPREIGREESR